MPAQRMANLTIALVAGEASGDILGAALMAAIKLKHPATRFVGIGGTGMINQGLECWNSIDRLSVNGFVEPIKRLPELWRILVTTRDRVVADKVDCFVGVDFNFFNLWLERMLKDRGVPTVHYVSPTVWAWRKWRIRSIAKSVDLMLALYPFEADYYEKSGIDVAFVGHPSADRINRDDGDRHKGAARAKLGFSPDETVVAVLPGSRGSEIKYSGPDFVSAAVSIAAAKPGCRFVLPAANPARRKQIEEIINALATNLDIKVIDGDSLLAMQAADVVLVNSGTATLEALLLKRPMVVSYRLGAVTYGIVSRMVTTPFFALPNILAGRRLVPEYIQHAATPEALSSAVVTLIEQGRDPALLAAFDAIHTTLRKDSAAEAARAVLALCERSKS